MAKPKTQKQRANYNRGRNSELLAAMVAPPPPVAPTPLAPTPNADDMLRINDWLTNFNTQIEDIDFGIASLETDTKVAKGNNDRQALQNRAASDDAMAARGIFRSSLRDAAVYDIEATRSLANTYLDTKLNEAVTNGTTRKNSLAQAKTAFETGMRAKYAENVAPLNAASNEAYATALANYKPPTVRAALPATPAQKFAASQAAASKASSNAIAAAKAKPKPPASPKPPAPKKPAKPKKP